MNALAKWLPHPLLSILLWGLWLLLNNTLAPGHMVLGALLAWLIPLFTLGFWPDRVCLHKPWLILKYLVRLVEDTLVANLHMARWVLKSNTKLHPTFVLLELTVTSPWAISALATTVSITPGTVVCDVTPDQRYLLIHILHTNDPAALVTTMKQRYEQLLLEIIKPC